MAFPSTFADITAAVIAKLRLNTTADTAKVQDWINQVYAEVCVVTAFNESSSVSSALAAAATSLTLPSAVIVVEYIIPTGADGTVWGPMEQVPFTDILRRRAYSSGATSSSGAPSAFALRLNTVEFWPSAVGGETLTFYGTILPTALTGTAVPILPEPFASKLLEYGALAEGADFSNDPAADSYRADYDLWMAKFRTFVSRRRGGRVQNIPIAGTQNTIPHLPSTDVRW